MNLNKKKTNLPERITIYNLGNQPAKTYLIDCLFDQNSQPRYICGRDFHQYNVKIEQKDYKIELWDTPQNQKYFTTTAPFLNTSQGFVLYYGDNSGLQMMKKWIKQIKIRCTQNSYACAIVRARLNFYNQNQQEIDKSIIQQAKKIAKQNNFLYIEKQLKIDKSLKDVYEKLVQKILKQVKVCPEKPNINFKNQQENESKGKNNKDQQTNNKQRHWLKKLFNGSSQQSNQVQSISSEKVDKNLLQKYEKLNQSFSKLRIQNENLEILNQNLKKNYQNNMKKERQNNREIFDQMVLKINKYENQKQDLQENLKEKQRIIMQLRQQIIKIQKKSQKYQEQNFLEQKKLQ